MIAGGSEAAITPLGVGGFAAMRALSTRNDDPARASRPFDRDRDGFVIGEGAGILLIEELEQAKARGAKIYCEITGYGMSGDAFHITSPCEDGDGAIRVMRATLKDAGVEPAAVDYVNCHGTSTPVGDPHGGAGGEGGLRRPREDEARDQLHQVHDRPSPGGRGGHGGGGDGARRFGTRYCPPRSTTRIPIPACDLDFVPNVARKTEVRHALSNSFGFGGTNGALLFSRLAG
jgi:3-oxoacyl-[acyl-carrier-protein] synthase II